MEGVTIVLKVSELNKILKDWAYQKTLPGKYYMLKGEDIEIVDEWEKVRRYSAAEVYQ